jgi:dienelactone hydrolase
MTRFASIWSALATLLLVGAVFSSTGCPSPVAPFPDTADTDPDAPTPGDPLDMPEAMGPHSVTMFLEDIPSADRTLRTRIFVPDTELRFVAMILPGFLIEPAQYDSYAMHLASHGYVAMIVNLPGGLGNNRRTHVEMATDVGFALNWLDTQDETRLPGIDVFNVFMVGHSLGGKVGLLRATEDARIRAFVALDPIDSSPYDTPDYPSVTPELMGSLSEVPIAFVGETTNSENCAPAAQNFEQYYNAATGPALKVHALTANHVSWLDDPECGALCNACPDGTDNPEVTRRMTRGLILAFFEHFRFNRPGARDHFLSLAEYVGNGSVTVESKNGL